MQMPCYSSEGEKTVVEFESLEVRRKHLPAQLLFAEDKSAALLQTTLRQFEACFEAVKPQKARFDAFDYDQKSAMEIIVRILPTSKRFSIIRKHLEKRGLLPFATQPKPFEGDAVETTLEYKERVDELISVLIDCSRKELGPKPGGKAFVRWFFEFMGILEPRGNNKQQWFDQRMEFIDELAYDYARYGLTPHAELQDLSHSFAARFNATYQAACAQYGRKTKSHNPFIRKWIALRKSALTRGRSFDSGITPEFLKKLAHMEYCPVTGVLLEVSSSGEYSCEDNRWSVERQCNELGYSCSNITLTSNKVNKIRGALNGFELFERAAGAVIDERLTRIQWCRLFNLHKWACSYAEPYLAYASYPIAWCNMFVEEGEIAEEAGSVLGLIAESKNQLKGFPVTESYLRDSAKKDPIFASWTHEKLTYAVGRLYSVVRQQLKNDHRQALNFCGLFEPGDGKADHMSKTTVMKRLMVILADEIADQNAAAETDGYDLMVMKSTLHKGMFSSGGYASF